MNLKNISTQFQNKRIIVIGDIIIDEYIWGDVNRISPEAPVPIIDIEGERLSCGGAANVAQNLRSLGANAELIGVIGKDRDGEKLLQMLNTKDIETSNVIIDIQRYTSKKTRVIVNSDRSSIRQQTLNNNKNIVPHQGHHLLRVDRETKQDISGLVRNHIIEAINTKLDEVDAIIFADYDKGVFSQKLITTILEHAKSINIPIVVDPKRKNFWNYRGVTALTPNHREIANATQEEITDVSHLIEIGEKVLDKLSLKSLLITREEEGMSLFQRATDGVLQVEHIPSHSTDVVDVTGAGDTVIAVFTLALAAAADNYHAALLSSLAAGLAVGKMGCANVTPEELNDAIERWEATNLTE